MNGYARRMRRTSEKGSGLRVAGISAAAVTALLVSACSNLQSPSDSNSMQRAAQADQAMIAAYNDLIGIQVVPGEGLDASIAKSEPAFNNLKSKYSVWDQAMNDVDLPETPGDGLPSREQLSEFTLAMATVINQNEVALVQAKTCAADNDPARCVTENTGPGRVWDLSAFRQSADRLAAAREALRNPPN